MPDYLHLFRDGSDIYLHSGVKSACVLGLGWGLWKTMSPPRVHVETKDERRLWSRGPYELFFVGTVPIIKVRARAVAALLVTRALTQFVQSLAWAGSVFELYRSHEEHNWMLSPLLLVGTAVGIGGAWLR